MAESMPVCDDCGHRFDAHDNRGRVREGWAMCPLCTTLAFGTTTAFAVWNGCQGTFHDGLRGTYAEAEEILNGYLAGIGTCVAPVLVMVAPDSVSHRFIPEHGRFIDEAERERLWRRECESAKAA